MQSPENDIRFTDSYEPAFGLPLLGYARGDDPLWQSFKRHVGSFHWTPGEAFSLAFPKTSVPADELSVIVWIIPQTEATLADHRKVREWPSERWARSRIFGERYVNEGLRRHLCRVLAEHDVMAVAPALLAEWSDMPSEDYVYASTWSERHAAFVAGLGTFGICDGLITPRGKAIRVGSVIARVKLPVTERAYHHHMEYCLFSSQGTCGACIRKCPANALSPNGHDKRLCKDYLDKTAQYVREHFQFDGYGCGFCQVNVPCERGIPHRNRSQ